MTQAQQIIDRFGSVSALARALGHRNPTTVQGWKDRGFIPQPQHAAVIAAARAAGIELEPECFIAHLRSAS